MLLRAISTAIFTLLLFLSSTAFCQPLDDSISADLRTLSELLIQQSPDLQRQAYTVQLVESDRQLAKGVFDYRLVSGLNFFRDQSFLLEGDSRFSSVGGELLSNTFSFNGGISRTFRTGLQTNIGVNYSRFVDSYPFDQFGDAELPYLATNLTSLRVSFVQPLLRGRGKKFAAANESFAIKALESANLQQEFVLATEVFSMLLTYWDYVASYERLKIFKENEERIQQVYEITEELVSADRKSINELNQIKADLANQQRQTILAEQTFLRDKQNLGRIIGLSEEDNSLISVPISPFPRLEDTGYSPDLDTEAFFELAQTYRTDIQSLQKFKEAQEINLARANNDMNPQVDLLGAADLGGSVRGNSLDRAFTPLGQLPGNTNLFQLGLSFQFPINNNEAQANLLASQVAVNDQTVNIENRIRNIHINIQVSTNNLHFSALKLERARENLEYSQAVFQAEELKFKNGLTTLINLILFQQRLTFAQLDYLDSLQEFAVTLAQLRNETGTLVPFIKKGEYLLDINHFYRVP